MLHHECIELDCFKFYFVIKICFFKLLVGFSDLRFGGRYSAPRPEAAGGHRTEGAPA